MAKYINIEKFENTSPCCPNCGNNCKHECEFFTSIFTEDIVEDVAPVIYAHWVEKEWAEEVDNHLISNYECSNCKEWVRDETLYCPHCGAKMDKE